MGYLSFYFEMSERKKRLLPFSNGQCQFCEHWDQKEYKPEYRACLIKIFNGQITLVCRKDDSCKSFKKKAGK